MHQTLVVPSQMFYIRFSQEYYKIFFPFCGTYEIITVICLSLAYFTEYNALEFHPRCHKWQDFLLFLNRISWIIFFNHIFFTHLSTNGLSMLVLSHFSRVWLCNPMRCSPPGSSALGILQARILEWVAISSSKESSWDRDWTQFSCIAGRFFTV